jgi:hypothetical protein
MIDDPITIEEQYAVAVSKGRGDIEWFIAAAYATVGDADRSAALFAHNIKTSGSRIGMLVVADRMECWLVDRARKGGRSPLTARSRNGLARDTLEWWIKPTCHYCLGTKRVELEGAARLADKSCDACRGSGVRPLEREVPRLYAQEAQWLADRLESLSRSVVADLARLKTARETPGELQRLLEKRKGRQQAKEVDYE